jgi:hypothetical protein
MVDVSCKSLYRLFGGQEILFFGIVFGQDVVEQSRCAESIQMAAGSHQTRDAFVVQKVASEMTD